MHKSNYRKKPSTHNETICVDSRYMSNRLKIYFIVCNSIDLSQCQSIKRDLCALVRTLLHCYLDIKTLQPTVFDLFDKKMSVTKRQLHLPNQFTWYAIALMVPESVQPKAYIFIAISTTKLIIVLTV